MLVINVFNNTRYFICLLVLQTLTGSSDLSCGDALQKTAVFRVGGGCQVLVSKYFSLIQSPRLAGGFCSLLMFYYYKVFYLSSLVTNIDNKASEQ